MIIDPSEPDGIYRHSSMRSASAANTAAAVNATATTDAAATAAAAANKSDDEDVPDVGGFIANPTAAYCFV